MPRGDKRGPLGAGPMTGRGMGYCAGYDYPGFANPAWASGFGRGFRGGYGPGGRAPYQAMSYGPPAGFERPFSKDDEIRYLRDQANYCGRLLEQINRRIAEIENKKTG